MIGSARPGSPTSRRPRRESEPVDSEKDEVLSLNPAEGATVALDDQITITYATGKSPVPNLVNRTEGQAEEDAEALGFNTEQQDRGERPAGGHRHPTESDGGHEIGPGRLHHDRRRKGQAEPTADDCPADHAPADHARRR